MSTQPLDIDRWSATGVDLETRRRRILAALAAMSHTEEQQQFRRTLAKRTQAALATENYGLPERYIQSWYLHVIALQTRPGWAAEWDREAMLTGSQIAKASSSNATANRRFTGSSTASS
jgi:hypothetical protein